MVTARARARPRGRAKGRRRRLVSMSRIRVRAHWHANDLTVARRGGSTSSATRDASAAQRRRRGLGRSRPRRRTRPRRRPASGGTSRGSSPRGRAATGTRRSPRPVRRRMWRRGGARGGCWPWSRGLFYSPTCPLTRPRADDFAGNVSSSRTTMLARSRYRPRTASRSAGLDRPTSRGIGPSLRLKLAICSLRNAPPATSCLRPCQAHS